MTPQAPFRTVVRTQSELQGLWRSLMEPLGFSRSALWLTVLIDDTTTGVLVEIADLPALPDPEDLAGFRSMITHVVGGDPTARLAMLLARPGGGGPTGADRAWARALLAAAQAADVAVAQVHLATDHDVRAIAGDDTAGDG